MFLDTRNSSARNWQIYIALPTSVTNESIFVNGASDSRSEGGEARLESKRNIKHPFQPMKEKQIEESRAEEEETNCNADETKDATSYLRTLDVVSLRILIQTTEATVRARRKAHNLNFFFPNAGNTIALSSRFVNECINLNPLVCGALTHRSATASISDQPQQTYLPAHNIIFEWQYFPISYVIEYCICKLQPSRRWAFFFFSCPRTIHSFTGKVNQNKQHTKQQFVPILSLAREMENETITSCAIEQILKRCIGCLHSSGNASINSSERVILFALSAHRRMGKGLRASEGEGLGCKREVAMPR